MIVAGQGMNRHEKLSNPTPRTLDPQPQTLQHWSPREVNQPDPPNPIPSIPDPSTLGPKP